MKYILGLLSAVILMTSCGGEDAGFRSGEVLNPPTMPVDTLESVIEIGVELGDSAYVFGAVSDAVFDERGRILVLDQVAADLRLYDEEGIFLEYVTARGSGPGMLAMPWSMFFMDDGRLMLMDMMKLGYVVFDDSLAFAEEISNWPQNPPFQGMSVSDSQFVAYKIDTDMQDNNIVMKRSVVLYDYGQEDWSSAFWQDSMTMTQSEIMADPSKLILDLLDPLSISGNSETGVFFSLKDGEEYSVLGWDLEGREIFNVSMDLNPVDKSAEEIRAESLYVNRYIERMAGGGGGGNFPFKLSPDPHKNMVEGVDLGPDGNLWVRRGTRSYPFFDVFDIETEELLRHVVYPDEGWSWKTVVSPRGIIAWEEDPEEGYQVLQVLEVPQSM